MIFCSFCGVYGRTDFYFVHHETPGLKPGGILMLYKISETWGRQALRYSSKLCVFLPESLDGSLLVIRTFFVEYNMTSYSPCVSVYKVVDH